MPKGEAQKLHREGSNASPSHGGVGAQRGSHYRVAGTERIELGLSPRTPRARRARTST